MAIVEFTPANVPATSSRAAKQPRVNINQKKGTFNFNNAAGDLLGLSASSGLKFVFDEESPEDWFAIKHKDGFPVRVKKTGFVCQSSYTAKKMLESHSISENSVSCMVKVESVKINKEPAHLLLFIKR